MGFKGMRSFLFMEYYFSVHCLILLLLNPTHCFSFVQSNTLCHANEHSALLQFKQSFIIDKSASSNSSASPKVSSWSSQEEGKRSDCCSWDGVDCNADSGHVIGLDLSSSCLYGSLNSNSTLFQLVHLQRLDLSDNNFNLSQIPSRLGLDLTSLTYLNLSKSSFSGQIPSQISKLSMLATLDLSFNYNSLTSTTHLLELNKANFRSLVQNLTNIKQLHLSQVELNNTVPDILANASSLVSLRLEDCWLFGEFPVGIFHLPNLEVLDLKYNPHLTGYFPENLNGSSPLKELDISWTNFFGSLPASIGDLHSLELLDISHCNFSLQVFDSWSWVGKLTKLKHLGVAYNYLTGQIPSWLMKLTQLTSLYLQFNSLQGPLPTSFFLLQNLENLDLSSNNLSGVVEFDEFSNLKRLRELRLSSNNLYLHIKAGFSAIAPQFEVLALGSCNLGQFPEFLNNQYNLQELGLSYNRIHGQIPRWMWNATRNSLRYLNITHNFLTGIEQSPGTLPWLNLFTLDLRFNRLQGSLPVPPPSVTVYSVPNNHYTGEIPPSFCNLDSLAMLDLSYNMMSGMLPQCFGNFSALKILKLRNNSFHGDIPHMWPRDGSLAMIDLSYNQFQGKLPRSLANCTQLEFLNFENNQISDIFPSWLGALPLLRILILRSNGFHGIIGKPATNYEFPKLCIIDLSNNSFSGMLPSNYLENWDCMKLVGEDDQTYFGFSLYVVNDIDYSMTISSKGAELKYLKTPYHLKFIDLSSNRFEGEIPEGIVGNLRGLRLLNLANNILTGPIPSSLGNLTSLESLDLSQNKLSGKIPNTLTQLNFLAYFNASYNHLWGTIPHGQQFDTFEDDSYQGNSGLCGKPLSMKCEDSESSTTPPSIYEEDGGSGFQIELDWYVVLPGVVSGLVVGVVTGNMFTRKKHEWFVKTFYQEEEATKRQKWEWGHRT